MVVIRTSKGVIIFLKEVKIKFHSICPCEHDWILILHSIFFSFVLICSHSISLFRQNVKVYIFWKANRKKKNKRHIKGSNIKNWSRIRESYTKLEYRMCVCRVCEYVCIYVVCMKNLMVYWFWPFLYSHFTVWCFYFNVFYQYCVKIT